MTTNSDPNSDPDQNNYQDLVIRPEFRHLRLRFPQGSTWFRILPGVRESAYNWLLPILVLDFPGGRFVDPASFDPNKRSVYDVALEWFVKNDPRLLQSKDNKTGYRLRPREVCVLWAVEYSEAGGHRLRLVLESFNTGVKGPKGLAREIWRKVLEKDENGFLMGNALDPDCGVMIHIERCKRNRYHAPLDWIRLGRIPNSVNALLEKVSPMEKDLLCPLERVIREPTVDEQWDYLGRLISPELADHIRTFTQRRKR